MPEATRMTFGQKYHVWDIRQQRYCGYTDGLPIRLDLRPQYYALMPARPSGLTLEPERAATPQGRELKLTGRVEMDGGEQKQRDALGQVVHVRVYGPGGQELEWYRQNVVFVGARFQIALPISYSETPGRYTVEVDHVITGMRSKTCFDVVAAIGR